jgi:hypothetical protein
MYYVLSIDLGKRNLGWSLFKQLSYDDPDVVLTNKTIELDSFGIYDIDNEIQTQTITVTKTLKSSIKQVQTKRFKDTQTVIARPTVLVEFLESIRERTGDNLQKVIVEKQNINNPLAMTLQSVIITYCITKSIEVTSFDPKVKFDNASKMFASAKSAGITNINQLNTTKKEHKKLIVDMAREVIENYSKDEKQKEQFVASFNHHSKKDDISDSLVQAVVYLRKNE